MSKNPCQAYQSGDSMRCGACGLQWDTNDPEPPHCAPATLGVRDGDVAKLRKRFELWAAQERYSLAQVAGEYFNTDTRKAWAAFRAGYKLPH